MRHIDDPRRRLLLAAIGSAAEGVPCLHTFRPMDEEREVAPLCFRKDALWGHLFDQNAGRLRQSARLHGVRKVFVHRPGEPGQHVALCGKPLGLAMIESQEVPDEIELARLMRLGQDALSARKVCPDCGGRGRVSVRLPTGRQTELSCDTCDGTGLPGRRPVEPRRGRRDSPPPTRAMPGSSRRSPQGEAGRRLEGPDKKGFADGA